MTTAEDDITETDYLEIGYTQLLGCFHNILSAQIRTLNYQFCCITYILYLQTYLSQNAML